MEAPLLTLGLGHPPLKENPRTLTQKTVHDLIVVFAAFANDDDRIHFTALSEILMLVCDEKHEPRVIQRMMNLSVKDSAKTVESLDLRGFIAFFTLFLRGQNLTNEPFEVFRAIDMCNKEKISSRDIHKVFTACGSWLSMDAAHAMTEGVHEDHVDFHDFDVIYRAVQNSKDTRETYMRCLAMSENPAHFSQ